MNCSVVTMFSDALCARINDKHNVSIILPVQFHDCYQYWSMCSTFLWIISTHYIYRFYFVTGYSTSERYWRMSHLKYYLLVQKDLLKQIRARFKE